MDLKLVREDAIEATTAFWDRNGFVPDRTAMSGRRSTAVNSNSQKTARGRRPAAVKPMGPLRCRKEDGGVLKRRSDTDPMGRCGEADRLNEIRNRRFGIGSHHLEQGEELARYA